MKSLLFFLVMTASSMSFAQVGGSAPTVITTKQTRSVATTAEMVCTMTTPDGDYTLEMLFDYDIDARTYTLSKVGAAGRGTTVNSPDYLWEIKSDIDLSLLAANVVLSQPDGSFIEFTMLARQTGIVMRRGDDGFLPTQSLSYKGLIKGKTVSGSFKCWDTEMPMAMRGGHLKDWFKKSGSALVAAFLITKI